MACQAKPFLCGVEPLVSMVAMPALTVRDRADAVGLAPSGVSCSQCFRNFLILMLTVSGVAVSEPVSVQRLLTHIHDYQDASCV